jgi:hypothetical protein
MRAQNPPFGPYMGGRRVVGGPGGPAPLPPAWRKRTDQKPETSLPREVPARRDEAGRPASDLLQRERPKGSPCKTARSKTCRRQKRVATLWKKGYAKEGARETCAIPCDSVRFRAVSCGAVRGRANLCELVRIRADSCESLRFRAWPGGRGSASFAAARRPCGAVRGRAGPVQRRVHPSRALPVRFGAGSAV